ncbi:MAG: glycosyltransferase family 2 protein [Verrucomicrobiales bacterium]
MPGPLISIVTPTYNQAAWIRQTIDSVLSQDYQNFEFWVIDGGSTDETLSILRSYKKDSRLKWISEKDRGQSHAINKGIEHCRGEIFNWINSDDYFEPGCFRKVADGFARDRTLNLFTGNCRKFEDKTGETNGYLQLELKGNPEETLAIGRYCQPSTFWKLSILKEWGGVREDLHCAMDFHIWARYLVQFGLSGIHQVKDALAHYREHTSSKSAKLNAQFKDEINGVYLNLLQKIDAPEYLTEYFAGLTSKTMDLRWQENPGFDRKRFMSVLLSQAARKFYYEKAYSRSRTWTNKALEMKIWREALRLRFKLMFKP